MNSEKQFRYRGSAKITSYGSIQISSLIISFHCYCDNRNQKQYNNNSPAFQSEMPYISTSSD
jgi:hypothetical protein